MNTPIRAKTLVFALDCPDARELAGFYAQLLGWQVTASTDGDDEWVTVKPPADTGAAWAGFHIACQRVENYRPPEWPDGDVPQQAHIDFWIDSIAENEPMALALGATRHSIQPGEHDGWIVYRDPAGHLFCLCEAD